MKMRGFGTSPLIRYLNESEMMPELCSDVYSSTVGEK